MDESTKRCTGCGLIKPLSEFHRGANGFMGRRSRCKICDRESNRRYRETNRESVRDYARRYREANRDALIEYNRRAREDEAYREAEREKGRQYYADNREEVLERKRRWKQENREDRLEARRRRRREDESYRRAEQEHKRLYRAHIQALVLNHYGWRCACCGTTRTLSIDHVNGGGKKHREALFGRADGDQIYLWLIEQGFPPGYQTLCNRCNASKAGGDHCRLVHDS